MTAYSRVWHVSKPGVIVGTILALAAGFIGILYYLSYGVKTAPPARHPIQGLAETVSIYWAEEGPVHIQAEGRGDFYTALGYTHGMNRPWISLLMRQASLGKLSEWFGQEAWDEDRLARSLELAKDARRSFDSLSPEVRTQLERYADGMTAALMTKRVQRKAVLVLLEIVPESWQPWHSIAVERLWAWLSAPVQRLDPRIPGVQELLAADRSLRSRLHVFGMGENMNLLIGGGQQMRHLLRYLMGNSGQPILQEFAFASSAGERIDGLSIPGTILFPAGRTYEFSWTLLMAANVSVDQVSLADITSSETIYDRLKDAEGFEEVVQIERINGALAIDDSASTDSLRTLLKWSGMNHSTDSESWIKLTAGILRPFSLFRDDGIVNKSGVGATITGFPLTSFRHPSGVLFISNSESGSDLKERLQEIISGQTEAQSDWDLLHDTFSTSAKKWTDRYLLALDSVTNRTVRENEAVDYLRNWDLSYRGSSIAASIAEYADQELRRSPEDSLLGETAESSLANAVMALTRRYTADMREWRWESVQELQVYYPGWMSTLTTTDRRVSKFQNEFLPVSVAGRGHPTSLSWGPAIDASKLKAATAWEGLFGSRPGSTFEFERPIVRYASFLGRFLPENRAPVSVHMGVDEMEYERTELRPAR